MTRSNPWTGTTGSVVRDPAHYSRSRGGDKHPCEMPSVPMVMLAVRAVEGRMPLAGQVVLPVITGGRAGSRGCLGEATCRGHPVRSMTRAPVASRRSSGESAKTVVGSPAAAQT